MVTRYGNPPRYLEAVASFKKLWTHPKDCPQHYTFHFSSVFMHAVRLQIPNYEIGFPSRRC